MTRLQATLDAVVPPGSVRWTRPEQIHLTLQFLGAVSVAAHAQRAMRTVGNALAGVSFSPDGDWAVEAVELQQSMLQPAGAVYTPLTRVPLGSVVGNCYLPTHREDPRSGCASQRGREGAGIGLK